MAVQDVQESFVEPSSLEEARRRRATLNRQVLDIQTQLSRGTLNVDSGQMTMREYREWRKQAVYAANAKQQESTWLKGWVSDHTPSGARAKTRTPCSGKRPTALAQELRGMIGRLYGLYLALGDFLADPSDGNRAELELQFESTQEFLGDASE